MPCTIESLKHDDLDKFVQLWWDSFAPSSADQVLPMIYRDGMTPELLDRLKRRIMNETDGDTVEYCFCARDDESQQIVGISWWKPATKPTKLLSDEEAKKEVDEFVQKKNLGPQIKNMDVQLGDAFYRALYLSERRTIKAKQIPYITLTVLGVHPDFNRKGVGSQLLEHGLKRVDSLNVSTWLVASSNGRGLYLKHGFEVVEELDFDATKYGGRSNGAHCIMLRSPQES